MIDKNRDHNHCVCPPSGADQKEGPFAPAGLKVCGGEKGSSSEGEDPRPPRQHQDPAETFPPLSCPGQCSC